MASYAQDLSSPPIEPGTIRVLILEHERLIRLGLATVLSPQPDMTVAAEAATEAEALRLTRLWRPDVLLIGLLPHPGGNSGLIRQIVAESPSTHVIALTSGDADEHLFEAITSGAEGFLLKDASDEEILAAIRAVIRQECYLSPKVSRKLLNEFRRLRPVTEKLSSEPLTKREARILELVVEGRSNKEIAAAVFLAEGTVKNYVSRIMEKLSVQTRTQLAILGMRHPSVRGGVAPRPLTSSEGERAP